VIDSKGARHVDDGGAMLESALTQVLYAIRTHGPLLLFLAAFLENAALLGLVVPGEKLVLLGGYLVQQGAFTFEIAWLCVFLGAIGGDTVGYMVGRYAGARIIHRLPGGQAVARIEALLQRHGGWVIFFGRFSGVLRPVLFLTIGMMRVPYQRFWILEAVSAAAWTSLWLGVGVIGGSLFDSLGEMGPWVPWLSLGPTAVGFLVAWHYRDRIRHLIFGDAAPEAVGSDGARVAVRLAPSTADGS